MQTVNVGLPKPLFLKLERAAELTQRSVEDILVTIVNAALMDPSRDAASPRLPEGLADELAAMHFFSDASLQDAMRPSMSTAEQSRLSQLNHIAGERTLTESEAAEQERLLAAYHRSVLRRAKAMAVLAQRGHSLPDDIKPPG